VKHFEEVEHTADCALRIFGKDLRELMQHAAEGMNRLLGATLPDPPEGVERQIELQDIDVESLLVDWLSELAYLAESEMLVFDHIRIDEISPVRLKASLRGCRASDLTQNIKAVTYHNLAVLQTENGLEATVVFDL
jgi:SHS2 domain-containing protein